MSQSSLLLAIESNLTSENFEGLKKLGPLFKYPRDLGPL